MNSSALTEQLYHIGECAVVRHGKS